MQKPVPKESLVSSVVAPKILHSRQISQSKLHNHQKSLEKAPGDSKDSHGSPEKLYNVHQNTKSYRPLKVDRRSSHSKEPFAMSRNQKKNQNSGDMISSSIGNEIEKLEVKMKSQASQKQIEKVQLQLNSIINKNKLKGSCYTSKELK